MAISSPFLLRESFWKSAYLGLLSYLREGYELCVYFWNRFFVFK